MISSYPTKKSIHCAGHISSSIVPIFCWNSNCTKRLQVITTLLKIFNHCSIYVLLLNRLYRDLTLNLASWSTCLNTPWSAIQRCLYHSTSVQVSVSPTQWATHSFHPFAANMHKKNCHNHPVALNVCWDFGTKAYLGLTCWWKLDLLTSRIISLKQCPSEPV